MGWNIKGNDRLISEINITPLTDVMLVLLVIFMVTTPFIMTESFKIKLPKASTSDAEPGKGAVLAINEAGVISLNGRNIPSDELYSELKKAFDSGVDKNVVIKADGNTRHGVIVKALDTAKLAGATKLSIATEREAKR
ncbi:MAG: biopolymer transporter ExbD [Deltaproteobacteria bacterium]|nr:biopolymer transporter ExbD [Deltaproteobacteria bacterium]